MPKIEIVLNGRKTPPSLVDLCVKTAIDNVRYLGDVGETDLDLLDRILPHCTVDQLMHVEKCSEGRDLSPVTDKLWKKFYEKQFGAKNTVQVVERMAKSLKSYKWIHLYEAKSEDIAEHEKKAAARIKQLYNKETARGISSVSLAHEDPITAQTTAVRPEETSASSGKAASSGNRQPSSHDTVSATVVEPLVPTQVQKVPIISEEASGGSKVVPFVLAVEEGEIVENEVGKKVVGKEISPVGEGTSLLNYFVNFKGSDEEEMGSLSPL